MVSEIEWGTSWATWKGPGTAAAGGEAVLPFLSPVAPVDVMTLLVGTRL